MNRMKNSRWKSLEGQLKGMVNGLKVSSAAKVSLLPLFGAGLLSGISMVAFASERLPIGPAISATTILIALQWLGLGTLLGKGGLDQACFADSSSGKAGLPQLSDYWFVQTLPAGILVFGIGWLLLDLPVAVFLLIAICTDAPAVIAISELNARGFHPKAAALTALNLPAFVILICVASQMVDLDTAGAILILLMIKIFRCALAYRFVRNSPRSADIRGRRAVLMLQQVSNFLIFRGDQLPIKVVAPLLPAWCPMPAYLFVAKLVELLNNAGTTAGAVLFPAHVDGSSGQAGYGLKVIFMVLVQVPIVLALMWLGKWLWAGEPLSTTLLVSLGYTALLAYPLNFLSYGMMRNGAYSKLVRCQGASLGMALVALGFGWVVSGGVLFLPIFPMVGLTCLVAMLARDLDGYL